MKKIITFIIFTHLVFSPLMAQSVDQRVTTKSLENLAIYPSIEIPASVVSMNDSKLSSEVKAIVKNIPVLIGETVKKGQLLVELDTKDYKLKLKRAEVKLSGIESQLKLARYKNTQAKTLFKQKAITDELLQQREVEVEILLSELNSQKVAVAMAQRDIEKCLITAPFNAIVTERLTQVGELANTGTPLVRVIDASRIEVSVKVQPQDIKSLVNGSDFIFISQGTRYPLKLRQLTPVVDLIQRNQEARLIFKNKRALPGTSGILYWRQKLPHIPADFTLRRNKHFGIFIVQQKKAHFIILSDAKVGKPSPTNLPMNTQIIVDGRFALQEGMPISVDKLANNHIIEP